MFSIKVDDRQLIKDLEALGPKCKPVLTKAIRPLANEVKRAVKPLMPKRTGKLQKSLAVKPIKSKRFYTIGFRIFPRVVGKTKSIKGKYYAFAPDSGVKKGKGKQPARQFMRKGSKIAEAYLPKCREAIIQGIADVWNKR